MSIEYPSTTFSIVGYFLLKTRFQVEGFDSHTSFCRLLTHTFFASFSCGLEVPYYILIAHQI
jgi:hypothetical protein